MSDQFALGLLAQIVEQMQRQLDDLTLRVEELEAGGVDEAGQYLDGTPVKGEVPPFRTVPTE